MALTVIYHPFYERTRCISSVFFTFLYYLPAVGKTNDNVNPGFNKPLGSLIGRVLFKHQILTIGGVPPD